jgi:hypothetical protein
MTKTFKLVEGAANITKLIVSVTTRGKKLEADLHLAAVSTLNHAGLHGDITLANRLLDGLPASTRKNALREWYLAFGKFKWNEEDKTLAYDKSKQTMLDEAIATPFWEFKPEAAFKPLDIAGSLLSFLNRVDSATAKGQEFSAEELAVVKAVREMVVTNDGDKF